MSSRFVSGGAIDAASGEAVEAAAATASTGRETRGGGVDDSRKSEWEAVQKELEAERRRREERQRATAEGAGEEKSLYEVLEANKAAKQAAFEEANKIKNQFRALDEDEIEFLDEVKQKARDEEMRVRRETEEGLGAFREEQLRLEREAAKAAARDSGEGDAEDFDGREDEGRESWAAGRKRKRRDEGKGVLKGVKRRTSSGTTAVENGKRADAVGADDAKSATKAARPATAPKPATAPARTAPKTAPKTAPTTSKLGLVDYGSDDDDDD